MSSGSAVTPRACGLGAIWSSRDQGRQDVQAHRSKHPLGNAVALPRNQKPPDDRSTGGHRQARCSGAERDYRVWDVSVSARADGTSRPPLGRCVIQIRLITNPTNMIAAPLR